MPGKALATHSMWHESCVWQTCRLDCAFWVWVFFSVYVQD